MTRPLLFLAAIVLLGFVAALVAGRTAAVAQDSPAQTQPTEALKQFLRPVPPKSPHEALATFEVLDGFRMELVAHEPLVVDPAAAAFDENGLLYVAEMRDYPYRPEPGEKPLGRIRVLEDTDGDGVFDKSTVFAEHLLWPSGVVPWKQGVFVAASPDIWYMKDTDGDRMADVRRKVYTGFGIENQQGMLNNLIWGLDQKIYGATSVNGGRVRPASEPDAEPISVDKKDFRFDPVTGEFEAITGTVQFGNTFDDWNNRFMCSQDRPTLHAVLPEHYLARNPYLPVPNAIHNPLSGVTPIFRISPIETWREIRTRRRMQAGERAPTSSGASHHVIDAAAGVTVYRGHAYPDQYYGNLFVGGAQNNLVHRRMLTPDGVTFKSTRADEGTEFIRSSDNWFRPVNFVNAPDGTLYVLDLSREILEAIHIPLDVAALLDLTSGRDHGRIYRITPPGFQVRPTPRLTDATAEQLVEYLEHPGGWWRDMAHRLIYERQDKAAVAPLRRLLAESALPQGRLGALWSLEGLGSLQDSDIVAALADSSAGVREHAVRLAEPRLVRSGELLERVLPLADDSNARVRFQLAFTLGEVDDPRAITSLARIARRDAGDSWIRAAVLSSAAESADRLLAQLLGDRKFAERGDATRLLEQLALVVGVRNQPDEIGRVLDAVAGNMADASDMRARQSIVLGLGGGLKRSGGNLATVGTGSASVSEMLLHLTDQAKRTAANSQTPVDQREAAICLLGYWQFDRVGETLDALLETNQPEAVQLAAVRSLASFDDGQVAGVLLKRWRSYAPAVRTEVIRSLLSRERWIGPLLDAVDNGQVPSGQIDRTRRKLLLEHKDPSIREQANRLFGAESVSPRMEVIDRYQSALALEGNRTRGEKIYERECMTCHRLGDKGQQVGPNLALTRNRTADTLMVEILDPNREVKPSDLEYVVVDDQGRTFTGIVAAATASSITLKQARGVETTILRNNIEEMASTGKSLMPEGLEKNISPREMADLLAFLLTVQYQIGTTPEPVE